jgi:CHAD domain-containing protein
MVASSEAPKFAAEHAQKLLRQLAYEMNRVTKTRDAESVHSLRRSLRKFSLVLQLFKELFAGAKIHKIRRRVKKVMNSAQELRDLDTTLRLLSKAHPSGSSAVRSKLQARRKEREHLLVDLLKRWTERKSSSKWRAALQSALAQSDGDVAKITVHQTARKAIPVLAEKFVKRGKEAVGVNASLHDLQACQVAAIKFRDTLELLGPISKSPMNAWLPDVKRVQSVLVDLNDCQASRELISSYAIADQFDGWLKKRQRKAVKTFRQFWEETFEHRKLVSRPARRQTKKPAGRVTSTSRSANRKPAAVA